MSAPHPLLEGLREAWLVTAHPLVVEHRKGGEPRVGDADALWEGARKSAGALRDFGLRAGDRLAVLLPPGVAYVQWFLACLGARITFVPCASLAGVPAQAVVGGSGELAALPSLERASRPGERVLLRSGQGWERMDDDALREAAAARDLGPLAPGLRVWSGGGWRDRRSVSRELLPLLARGCAVHVGIREEVPPGSFAATPSLAIGASDRIMRWLERYPETLRGARLVALESLDQPARAAA